MFFKIFLLYIPETYLLLTTLIFLYYGSFFFSESFNFYRSNKISMLFTLSIIVNILLLLSIASLNSVFNTLFIIKMEYTNIIEIFLLFVVFLIVFTSLKYNDDLNISYFEFSIFILISLLSFFFLINSQNFILFYLLLELQGITFYVLTSLRKKSKYSIEAGLKYFILGSLSSIIILFGITIFYGFSGIVSFSDLFILVDNIFVIKDLNYIIILSFAIFFILVGLLFKIYCAPLHYWVPDIYQGAPTSTVFFFATIPPIILITLLIQIYIFDFFDFLFISKKFFYFFSVLSMIFGSLGALVQRKIKKLIALSTVLLIGNIFMLLNTFNIYSIINIYFFLIVYTINSIGLFIWLMNISFLRAGKVNSYIDNIYSLSGLSSNNKWVSISLLSIFFSFSGLPIFVGFFSKLFVYGSLIENLDYSLLSISLLTSLISSFYYIRLIKIIYYNKNDSFHWTSLNKISYYIGFFSFFFILFNIFLFINPSILLDIITISVVSHSTNYLYF
jgi:NADH-quinone oxidoreductase subunit N